KNGIEIRLGTEIKAVDPKRKRLQLASGDEFEFEKLLLATGSRPRKLTIPGSDLPGIQYLRTLDDSAAIRQRAKGAKRAVVIGSGFIGMEVASVLAQAKIDTTMVMKDDRVWKQFFTPEMSQFFEGYFSGRGVKFAKAAELSSFKGTNAVQAAQLADGR